eukprot:c4343_g1_i1.p1 GENE.c4343_g1_i1~~c4343_g1_i1.p1  ORF type:complete len:349 (+),score=143.31 c4343_g1_i1:113-1159(+)
METENRKIDDISIEFEANQLPSNIERAVLVSYRSIGLGLWGCGLRSLGMPLEKIALEANSGRVDGAKNQFKQAVIQVWARGWKDPFRCITSRSLTAWFLQYGLLGFTFQTIDFGLSKMFGLRPQIFGVELLKKDNNNNDNNNEEKKKGENLILLVAKGMSAGVLAASIESFVANRAESQRHLGPQTLAKLSPPLSQGTILQHLRHSAGPSYIPNVARNFIMCSTTFVISPALFQLLPQEQRTPKNLLLFGLGMNIFFGNSLAINAQSLWGRSLDHFAQTKNPNYRYTQIISEGLRRDGIKAFFSPSKWFARVLMNAPAQGTIPWFGCFILPKGEGYVLRVAQQFYNKF